MKMNLLRAALACAVFAFTSATAMAAIVPIPGVVFVLKFQGKSRAWTHYGLAVTPTQSDGSGQIELKDLPPGDYEIDIDGPSLVAAMDKLAPPAPAKSDGLSVGVSVGGLFGGSKQSNSQTNGHPGMPGGSSHDSTSSSGGGVGAGISVPIGGGEYHASDVSGVVNIILRKDFQGMGDDEAFETAYCRDAASKGMSIGFTVPPTGGSVTVEVNTHLNFYTR